MKKTILLLLNLLTLYWTYRTFRKVSALKTVSCKEVTYRRIISALGDELLFKDEQLKRHILLSDKMREKALWTHEVMKKIKRVSGMSVKEKLTSGLSLSVQEQKELLTLFDVCYDSFVSRLNQAFPLLSLSDLVLCCLIKVRIPPQDVLCLCNVDKQTLKKRKTRMKHQKMGIASDVSLDEFILNY